MNTLNLGPVCEASLARVDIEESTSAVDLNSYALQASYPSGDFSNTAIITSWFVLTKNCWSLGPSFESCIRTEDTNQASFCPYVPRQVSIPAELTFGCLGCNLLGIPPQINSPFETVMAIFVLKNKKSIKQRRAGSGGVSGSPFSSHLRYASQSPSQYQTRVKRERVFFPLWIRQARSPGCGFDGQRLGTASTSLNHSCNSPFKWKGISLA